MSSFESDKGGVNRHTVRCELHGLHFNPELTSGCVLCLREVRRGAASKSVRTILVAVAAAVLLVVSFRMAGNAPDFGDPSGGALQAGLDAFAAGPDRGASGSLELDPEPYREVITQIESVVYKKTRPSWPELRQTARAGRDLSERIQRRENPVSAGQAALKVLAWSSRSFELGPGYTPPDLEQARAGWERIRNGAFRRADWFRSAVGEPDAAPAARPALDLETLAALAEVGNDIFHLIAIGGPESEAIPEVADLGEGAAAVTVRRWEDWRSGWNRRVQRTAAKMPAAPDPSGDLNIVLAYQKMNSALHYLALVPITVHPSGVPLLHEREKRFEIARSEAEEGEQRLRALGR